MSRYEVPMCVDISSAIENVQDYSYGSAIFRKLIATANRAYLATFASLTHPIEANPVNPFVDSKIREKSDETCMQLPNIQQQGQIAGDS